MNIGMDFSRLGSEDIEACTGIFVRVFNSPPWNESWDAASVRLRLEDCFCTPGFQGVLVRISGEAVGFAAGHRERWDKGTHFYLKEMCIAPEHQQRGVGTALMDELLRLLHEDGVAKLYLHTARDTTAQAFYAKQGFYTSPKMIMMAKWLG